MLEEKLFAALLTSTPDDEIVAVRAEADRELAPYRRKDVRRRRSINCRSNTSTSGFWKNTGFLASACSTCEPVIHSFDALILGGGAAGLMCAIEAGKRGRRVALLEHADRSGKKILISGGGRCNFTNIHCRPENFISANPHFAKSALARYTPADFIALVEKHDIPYHEKTLGQIILRALRARHRSDARGGMPRARRAAFS